MFKMKMLLGMGILLSVAAIATTSADAEFEARNGSNTGSVTIGKGSAAVFKAAEISTSCAAAGISATWTVQASGKLNSKAMTKRGPRQQLAIKWQSTADDGKCTSEIAGIKLPSAVKPCNLQLEQVGTKVTEVNATFETECTIKVAECELKFPKGNELSKRNFGLQRIIVSDEMLNFFYDSTGIVGATVDFAGSICPAPGETTKATLTGLTGEAALLTLV